MTPTGSWLWRKADAERTAGESSKSASEHGDAYVKSVQDRGSIPLASSLRFFGEKTSAWQAFRFAKPTFLLRYNEIKKGGCPAVAEKSPKN